MLDADTFLTTLYVMIDDFAKASLPEEVRPGPRSSLTRSEVITLAVFSQWACFESERGFYRFAARHLRAAFPALPARAQLNRQIRHHWRAITAFCLYLSAELGESHAAYQALDSTAVASLPAWHTATLSPENSGRAVTPSQPAHGGQNWRCEQPATCYQSVPPLSARCLSNTEPRQMLCGRSEHALTGEAVG